MSTITNFEETAGIRTRVAEPPHVSPETELSVYVVFTSINGTLKALEKARELAQPLGANIEVVAVQVVPFPLPLDEPPVPMEFVVKRFKEIAGQFSERTQVSAYLCRDPMIALQSIFGPDSPVVIGVRKTWWPSRDARLGKRLQRAGYDVILVETE